MITENLLLQITPVPCISEKNRIFQFWLAEKGVQITNGSWLAKTQKKPPRTNQIWAVLTTKFKKMAMVFSRQRFDFVRKTTIEKLKNIYSKNPNTVKSTSFCLNVLFRHLKEQGYIQVFHDNNRDFKSRTLFDGGDRCPVTLFKSFVVRRPLLKHPCDGLFFFLPQ